MALDAATQDKINQAIKDSLPQQVGEALKLELAELTRLRTKTTQQAEEGSALRQICADKDTEIAQLNAKVKTDEDLAKREADVKLREFKQELNDYKVQAANERRQEAVELVKLVFRSPVYTTATSGNIPVPITGASGGGNYPGTPGSVSSSSFNTYSNTTES